MLSPRAVPVAVLGAAAVALGGCGTSSSNTAQTTPVASAQPALGGPAVARATGAPQGTAPQGSSTPQTTGGTAS